MIPEREKLLDCLSDEYKILQDKIDKIGGFRFTIKGWSITLVVAALFVSGATSFIPLPVLVCVLLLFIVLFFLVERRQARLSRSFSRRCLKIEHVTSKLLRRSENGARLPEFVRLHFAPGLANHLLQTHPQEFAPDHSFRTAIRDPDTWFYIAEALVVIFVFVVLQVTQPIGSRGRDQIIVVHGSDMNGRVGGPYLSSDESTASKEPKSSQKTVHNKPHTDQPR